MTEVVLRYNDHDRRIVLSNQTSSERTGGSSWWITDDDEVGARGVGDSQQLRCRLAVRMDEAELRPCSRAWLSARSRSGPAILSAAGGAEVEPGDRDNREDRRLRDGDVDADQTARGSAAQHRKPSRAHPS